MELKPVFFYCFFLLCFKFYESANFSEPESNTFSDQKSGQRQVMVDVYIVDVSSVNERDMDFRLDFVMRESWLEDISLCQSCQDCDDGKLTTLSKQANSTDNLEWIADLYFTEAKFIKSVLSSEMEMLTLTRVEGFCRLQYTTRIYIIVACQMDFHWYPFDTQHCSLTLRNYHYTEDQLKYEWTNDFEVNYDPQIVVHKHTFTVNKTLGVRNIFKATYSTAVLNFHFDRMAGNYVAQVYAPSFFILLVSWFCFWMGHQTTDITNRFQLLATSLLTLVLQFSGFRQDLPPISYVSGIDIWMSGCLLFLFLSLLETVLVSRTDTQALLLESRDAKGTKLGFHTTASIATIGVKGKHSKMGFDKKRSRKTLPLPETIDLYGEGKTSGESTATEVHVSKLDHICRYVFPFCFCSFAIIYFGSFLSGKFKHYIGL